MGIIRVKTGFVTLVILFALLSLNCGKKPKIIKAKYITEKEYQILSGYRQESVNSSFNYVFSQGVTLFQKERYDSARTVFVNALAFNNRAWRVYYFLGLIATRTQEYRKAEINLLTSLKYVSDDRKARSLLYLALGENYEQQENYGKAEQHFITALNLNPGSTSAKQGLRRLELVNQAK